MRKFFLTLILVIPLCCQSQLLWEVSGNKMKSKSYILGTHHLIPLSFLDSVPGLYPAYNRCKTVVGEIILDNQVLVRKMQSAAVMTGNSMRNLFLPDVYQKVDSMLKLELGMGLGELAMLKPAMIENIYTLTLYDKCFLLNDEDFQMDSFFQKIGEKDGKKLCSLETADEQIALLFESRTLERQAEILYGTLLEKNSEIEKMNRLNALYKKGDLEALLALSRETEGKIYEMTEAELRALLDDRNRNWMEKLPELFASSSCFVAVGALHLPGENGLVALLRKRGYKVKPVMDKK